MARDASAAIGGSGDPSFSRVARVVLPGVAALLAYWASAGGLFIVASPLQCALVVGVVAGLVSGARPPVLALSAALAYAVGLLTGPWSYWVRDSSAAYTQHLFASVCWIGIAALAAFAAARVAQRSPKNAWWLVCGVAVLVAVNLWGTVLWAGGHASTDFTTGATVPSTTSLLNEEIPGYLRGSDSHLYFHIYNQLRTGVPFYTAFAESPGAVRGGSRPASVLNVRFPTLLASMAMLGSPWMVLIAFLVPATLASWAPLAVARNVVNPAIALPGVLAVASYASFLGTSSEILYTEIWAGVIGAVCLGAVALSYSTAAWWRWTVIAVLAAVAAFAIRELSAFFLLAGWVAALVGPQEQRRFRVVAWTAGGVFSVALFGLHFVLAQPYLSHAAGQGVLGRGGWMFALLGVTYNSWVFGDGLWIPRVLGVLGLVGAFAAPKKPLLAFTAIALVLPFVAYLYFGNGARNSVDGTPLNYWAMAVLPGLYAVIALGARFWPGAASEATRPAR